MRKTHTHCLEITDANIERLIYITFVRGYAGMTQHNKSKCCGAPTLKDAPDHSGRAIVTYECADCGHTGTYTDVCVGAQA